MRFAKLLTFCILLFMVHFYLGAQCSLITKNGSSQDPKTVCAPVDFTMNVWFKFLIPVDTSLTEIRFEWNDGMGSVTTVKGTWNTVLDSVWAEESHIFPPTDECYRTVDAYMVYDGGICSSSGHQEQTFSTWGTDEENSGVLNIDPPVAYFCEGDDIINVIFDDNSTFNCNISIEPDNPNRYYRWVQFIYNTYDQAGDRIPDVTVDDGMGTVYTMTDNSGNFVDNHYGPIIQIPIPADGPFQTSYAISASAGGIAGDIFEITMRNWNVCNPYDNMPTDGNPPADIINGDNPPIVTTARIEIIAPPPVVVTSLFEFCTGDDIELTATAGAADINWYADAALTTLLHTGNTYDPEDPPFNMNNSVPGTYTFWVTSTDGICESAANQVDVVVYQSPLAVFAGNDQIICADSMLLNATPPSAGTGTWITTGGASIDNINNPTTWVTHLDHGVNEFTWTVANGICQTIDDVIITSDVQPDPAFAGLDDSICSSGMLNLNATPPNLGGRGHWLIMEGLGTLSDTAAPNAQLYNPSLGTHKLLWRVSSEFGACPVTMDTIIYLVDLSPGNASAGSDIQLCEISSYTMTANTPFNSGNGTWSTLSGSTDISDVNDPSATINNLVSGNNEYVWTFESQYDLCPSSSDTISIVRDLSPGIADAGSDIALCLENSDTLNGSVPLIGTGEWEVVENPSGTAPVFSPDIYTPDAIITVLPGNEGLYKLQWTLENGSCISRDTMILDFGIPPPPGFAGIDSIICGLSSSLQSNTFAQGHGLWTQLSGPATVNFSPDKTNENPQISVPTGGEGIYTFEWKLLSGACAPSSDTVEVTFLGTPELPITTGASSCGTASLTLQATVSEPDVIVEWFISSVAVIPFHTGESYTTPFIAVSETYYVESTDTITGCRSPRVPVTANIYPIPDAPGLTGDTICGAGNASLTATVNPPANTICWFENATGTTLLGKGLNQSIPTSISRYYWAQAIDTLSGCKSTLDSVFVMVYPAVTNPIPVHDSSCGTSDLTLAGIKSSGNESISWFDAFGATGPIHIADSINLIAVSTSTTYWIESRDNTTGCISNRIPVEAIIHATPSIPTINDTSSCGPAAFTLVPTGDINTTTFRWYDQAMGGALIHEGINLNMGVLPASESYWVSGYNSSSSCESSREQVDVYIYPNPAPLSIVGPTLVLKDQTGVIFSTTGNSTSTYNWTIPSGIDVIENMNDFVRLGFPNTGSYTISTIETTTHGCIGTLANHPITVISDSIAVDIGLYNQSACTGVGFEIVPYLFGGTPPYTYSWTGDIAYLTSTHSLFTTFDPPGTGTYHLYLDVTDVNLKTTRDSVEITVYTSPVATITTKDEIVCVGTELQLEVINTGYPPVSHLWTGPIHLLSAYTIQEPEYTPIQPDTILYYYQMTDINGCKATDSTYLYSDIPLAYFELNTDPGCSPLAVEINNLSQRAVGYTWTFGDGTTSFEENPVHTFVNETPEIKYYPITLEAVSTLGCYDDITQYAMVWPNPVATLEALTDNTCSPADVTLFTTPGNMNYYWDYGDGVQETNGYFSATHIYTTPGEEDETFKVQVITESSLNCVDTAFLSLNIFASPSADFAVTPSSDTFPDNTFEIQNTTEGTRWTHYWDLGDGRKFTLTEPGSIFYENPGNYTVSLTSSSEHCTSTRNKTIYLYPAPPQAKFTCPYGGCMPRTITPVNSSQYAEEYLWDFGDGNISTAPDPSYTYYEAGIYRITLTAKGPGGESIYSDTTRVYILPNSFFDMAPRYVYVNDEEVNFFNLSEHGDVFEWDFGDGNTSTDLNPKHVYKEAGTYNVTLKVWTNHECFDLYVMENAVFVEPSGVIAYPNAFRPDSPLEENREFLPGIIDHIDEYHLMIYNRWGELIFESFDQEEGWDGTYKGKRAKQDVYIWKVTGTYSDGKGFTKTGDVTLLY